MHSSVHSKIIYNSQNMETTEVSIDRWMNIKNVVYIYSEIILSHDKWNHAISKTLLDLEDNVLSEINQTEKDIYGMISLKCLIQRKIKWTSKTERLIQIANSWLPKGKTVEGWAKYVGRLKRSKFPVINVTGIYYTTWGT